MKKSTLTPGLTRRSFISTASVALLSSWGPLKSAQDTSAGSFETLRGDVGIFLERGGTIGWMVSPDAVVVIDSQFPASAKNCLEGVNKRSKNREIDCLINTHHHGDHTGGNSVFKPRAKRIVAHENVPKLMQKSAARNPNTKPTLPDTTFSETWKADLGKTLVKAKYYGRAHTSGDITIHFEKSNIVHLGDLIFNRRHPFIDRPAGATISGWINVLEEIVEDHDSDTLYIFGHANQGFKVTGKKVDLFHQRDYFTALLDFTREHVKKGTSRESFSGITSELEGFSDHGPLISRVLNVAYDEVVEGI